MAGFNLSDLFWVSAFFFGGFWIISEQAFGSFSHVSSELCCFICSLSVNFFVMFFFYKLKSDFVVFFSVQCFPGLFQEMRMISITANSEWWK